ncbi:MAG: sodium:solute symporter, partial [Saprospiraceae bacterium]|nr:sodium:solute symporter [Saprospiraceae bacterium]
MEQTATLHPAIILTIIIGYFVALVIVSYFTARNSDNQTFFLADRQSPWYVVAFGMVGGSLSGVTFISVPGWVGSGQFAYMQMVLGYLLGYYVIGWILIPLYYRANLTSIYTYLDTRFGTTAYRTGSAFFMLSRTIGSGFRMYIVIMVLQKFVFDAANIPFWVSSLMIIVFILIYTYKAGIKTIVWTDTLQTICLLSALFYTIYFVGNQMNLNASGIITAVKNSPYSQIFFFDGGWSDPNNFFKQFLSGAFIAIVMTGLDQDMMQKNLTCKNIGEAQKNIAWYSTTLVFVNLLFLSLGALLYLYCSQHGIE